MPLRIITKKRLEAYAKQYPDAKGALQVWMIGITTITPRDLAELRRRFPSADLVGRLTVFNIGGNKYRLIVRIEYQRQEVYLRHFFTHAEYDKESWKDDEWF